MPGFYDGAMTADGLLGPELITRVRALRRRALAPAGTGAPEEPSLQRQVNQLRAQVAHLEEVVEGLQRVIDSDARRQHEQLTEIRERIAPVAVAAAAGHDGGV